MGLNSQTLNMAGGHCRFGGNQRYLNLDVYTDSTVSKKTFELKHDIADTEKPLQEARLRLLKNGARFFIEVVKFQSAIFDFVSCSPRLIS